MVWLLMMLEQWFAQRKAGADGQGALRRHSTAARAAHN
jgi:hypothetical protein